MRMRRDRLASSQLLETRSSAGIDARMRSRVRFGWVFGFIASVACVPACGGGEDEGADGGGATSGDGGTSGTAGGGGAAGRGGTAGGGTSGTGASAGIGGASG